MAGRTRVNATTAVVGLCALAFCCYVMFVVAWHPGQQLASAPAPVASLRGATATKESSDSGKGPPTRRELGRGTWGLLHRMAAKYPQNPTPEQQEHIVQFLHRLGEFFPCSECAGHFRGMLKDYPPQTSSNLEYSLWLCRIHNIVNERVGNPQFQCDKDVLQERWGDCGCFDGSESDSTGVVDS